MEKVGSLRRTLDLRASQLIKNITKVLKVIFENTAKETKYEINSKTKKH